mmetsp:Transcript_7631/g.15134  ORF Transcript_7631/g.15134 Transcript_7631/m.15134 type:complete len:129 (+) Transcript_7631:108-494(+)
MFPSLLPATIEPVWCPVLGMDEEDALAQEEQAFEQKLAAIRGQRGPRPIGVQKKNLGEDEDEDDHEMVEDEEEEEEEEEEDEAEMSEMALEESDMSEGRLDEEASGLGGMYDDEDDEEEDEDYDSDAW